MSRIRSDWPTPPYVQPSAADVLPAEGIAEHPHSATDFPPRPSGLVIGIGNRLRGDDAAGCLVADALQAAPHPAFDIACSDGNVTGLLEGFGRYGAIVVVDAVLCSGAARLVRWDALTEPLPRSTFRASSHGFGAAEAIELARTLGALPRRLVVYGVPAFRFGLSDPLSEPTRRAILRTAARIRWEWGS